MPRLRRAFRYRHTAATIITEAELVPLAEAVIRAEYDRIRGYLSRDPAFGTALEPCVVPDDAPPIVRRMAAAAARAGVGPMAAVAGAIAASAVEALVAAGATHAIVDNGGDIALVVDVPVVVGLFAGPSPFGGVGLRIDPGPGVVAICTSSGTVGHSLSFGRADAAVVMAGDPALADAVATALGNRVSAPSRAAVARALAETDVEGIDTLLVVAGGVVGLKGRRPTLVPACVRIADIAGAEGWRASAVVRVPPPAATTTA